MFLALAEDGGQEVYGEEGISKKMNTEGHSGSGEEPRKALGRDRGVWGAGRWRVVPRLQEWCEG